MTLLPTKILRWLCQLAVLSWAPGTSWHICMHHSRRFIYSRNTRGPSAKQDLSHDSASWVRTQCEKPLLHAATVDRTHTLSQDKVFSSCGLCWLLCHNSETNNNLRYCFSGAAALFLFLGYLHVYGCMYMWVCTQRPWENASLCFWFKDFC